MVSGAPPEATDDSKTFADIFPTELHPSITGEARKSLEQLHGGNIVVTQCDSFNRRTGVKDYPGSAIQLQKLRASLAARHMHPGRILGEGNSAIIYELCDDHGNVMPSAVLRLDCKGFVSRLASPNPAFIREVGQLEEEDFVVKILPRAKKKAYTTRDVMRSLAALNCDHRLDYLYDLHLVQFMEVPGIDIPVLVDVNAFNSMLHMPGLHEIDKFIKLYGADLDTTKDLDVIPSEQEQNRLRKQICVDKLGYEEMTHLRFQQEAVRQAIMDELEAAGMVLDGAKEHGPQSARIRLQNTSAHKLGVRMM